LLDMPLGYGSPLAVTWSPVSDQLAVAFVSGGIVIYNSVTLETESEFGNDGYFLNAYPAFQSLTWSPDGRFLATNGINVSDGTDIVVRILDVSTGESTFIPGQEEIINAVVWSPDGKFIAAGAGRFPTPSQDNSVRVWDAETYEPVREIPFDKPITSISWNPEGTQLAAVDLDGAVYIIDIQ
jgi:WD40 repeat protein